MTVQVTTIMRPKTGHLKEALDFCRESARLTAEAGGKTRLYTSIAAGPSSGELIAVSEFDSMEHFGKMIDKGPPKSIIEHIRAGDDAPVELVSMNLGMEVPEKF